VTEISGKHPQGMLHLQVTKTSHNISPQTRLSLPDPGNSSSVDRNGRLSPVCGQTLLAGRVAGRGPHLWRTPRGALAYLQTQQARAESLIFKKVFLSVGVYDSECRTGF